MKTKDLKEMSPDEIRFRSLVRRMEKRTVSHNFAVLIVGGEKRLERLMSDGSIRCYKPEGSANRQWQINAADCFRFVKPKGFATRAKAV